ncbi:MAG: D-alanine--D-alanine ligase, partial [Candidatus Omnitrophica bacterium]|nr:D-alanine--D-alanine ligase [Candidatus Omnitrophota bacterium]
HLAYTGSDARASRLGMDKIASRRRFEAAGLRVPRWRVIELAQSSAVIRGFSYPLVVKPSDQGSSLGVSVVRHEAQLQPAIEQAAAFNAPVLIEEFVAGREVTAGVLGDEPLPVVEIHPHHAFFDFAAKYTAGETDYLVPAPLPEDLAAQVQAAGMAAHRALGCRHLSRTDIIVRPDGTPVVLEVNTIPGFTPTSLVPKAAACAGISYDELCERLVLMAIHSPVDATQ